MTLSRTFAAIAVVALTAQANADVWERATQPDRSGDEIYAALMQKGDDAALAADAKSISLHEIHRNIDVAIEAYRTAAKAKPKAAEPYFRIGNVLNAFFFDCDKSGFSAPPITCFSTTVNRDVKARETLEAWDTFESLAPLDPRINELLVQRALLRTKLVSSTIKSRPLLEGAARDYEAVLDREDGVLAPLYSQRLGKLLVLGNLAETHMMLGDVEKAIEVYMEAKRVGARSSTMFGLAVALDRDDRGGDAAAIIRGLGIDEYDKFYKEFEDGAVFFVPVGEEQYYFALANEVFGNVAQAIMHWRAYIQSGAHPKFQPRAKEHLEKLLLRKNLRWEPPIDLGLRPKLEPRVPPARIPSPYAPKIP